MISFRQIHDIAAEDSSLVREQANTIYRAAFPYDPQGFERIVRVMGRRAQLDFEPLLLVSFDRKFNLTGFAFVMHFPEIRIGYLQHIASDPRLSARGIGGALYEFARDTLMRKGATALLLDIPVTDPARLLEPERLSVNRKRLRFYEGYGARIIEGTLWDVEPNVRNEGHLTHMLLDSFGRRRGLGRSTARRAMRRILEAQYGFEPGDPFVVEMLKSVTDDPVRLRPTTAARIDRAGGTVPRLGRANPIRLVVAEGHEIHHHKERGYVERPVRIAHVLRGIAGLPMQRVPVRKFSDRHVVALHDPEMVALVREMSASLGPKAIAHPNVFPIRRPDRLPDALEDRIGYFCSDTFTPLTRNAYQAARHAVDVALTAADLIRQGQRFAYALCRPPGHHAERRVFGGFCYLNNAAIAAGFLASSGRVAVIDIDYHHGNGNQDIFYRRPDVLTLSIHGHPRRSFPHFSGYQDETGEGPGEGFNRNWPLEPPIGDGAYLAALDEAMAEIASFNPRYLVVSLGFDIMRGDPTGSFSVTVAGLRAIAARLCAAHLPTVFVQEGGYSIRNLRVGAEAFFTEVASRRFAVHGSFPAKAPESTS